MVVVVCGSRCWTDRATIHRRLAQLPADSVVIQGEAAGADTVARDEAARIGLRVVPVPADWRRYGKRAGPIRNRRMLDMMLEMTTTPTQRLVIAFHDNLQRSTGTAHLVGLARRVGVRVEVVDGASGRRRIAVAARRGAGR
jgi:YspA, cpYpsA-related SLOG family